MPRHPRLNRAARTQRPDLLTHQQRLITHNPLPIAHLGRIVIEPLHINPLRHIHRPIGRDDRAGRRIIHPIRPQIVDRPNPADLRRGAALALVPEDIRARRVHDARGVAAVEQDDQLVAAVERAGPELDLGLAVGVAVRGLVAPAADGGGAEGVLADGEDGGVGEDGEGVWGQGDDVVAEEEGGFDRGPEAEVRLVFVVGHAAVADFQRV